MIVVLARTWWLEGCCVSVWKEAAVGHWNWLSRRGRDSGNKSRIKHSGGVVVVGGGMITESCGSVCSGKQLRSARGELLVSECTWSASTGLCAKRTRTRGAPFTGGSDQHWNGSLTKSRNQKFEDIHILLSLYGLTSYSEIVSALKTC